MTMRSAVIIILCAALAFGLFIAALVASRMATEAHGRLMLTAAITLNRLGLDDLVLSDKPTGCERGFTGFLFDGNDRRGHPVSGGICVRQSEPGGLIEGAVSIDGGSI